MKRLCVVCAAAMLTGIASATNIWHDVPQVAIDLYWATRERCLAVGVTNNLNDPTNTIWHENIPHRFDITFTNLYPRFVNHTLTNAPVNTGWIYDPWTYTGILVQAIGTNEFLRPAVSNYSVWHYLVDVSQRWHVVTNLLWTEAADAWVTPALGEYNNFVGYYDDDLSRWVTNTWSRVPDENPKAIHYQRADMFDCSLFYGYEYYAALWRRLAWTITGAPGGATIYTYGKLAEDPSSTAFYSTEILAVDQYNNHLTSLTPYIVTQQHSCVYFENFGHLIPKGPDLGNGWRGWMTNTVGIYTQPFSTTLVSDAIGWVDGWTNVQPQGWIDAVNTNDCNGSSAFGYSYWILTNTGLVLKTSITSFNSITNLLTTNNWHIHNAQVGQGADGDYVCETDPKALQVWSQHSQGYEDQQPGRSVIKWGFNYMAW